MKKVIAFAGSNSKTSINKQLATYVANSIDGIEMKVLDLNDFNLPLYSIDLEKEQGIREPVEKFLKYIKEANGIVLSLAEHNGAYSAAFKNLFDWLSRKEVKFRNKKPMLLLATSPGQNGAKSCLNIAIDRFPKHDANIIASFSLPSFNDTFSPEGITDPDLQKELNDAIVSFKKAL
ncbi:NAD(P)H-dependent oxidoreductase [Lacinutrix neustonica]|uniref:NAD(P)H-dependent oxidoreductase n=1 Tax=Lacinutrix neustonica TaxID=2980107 RepID=A0A9E8MX32_9FLAO|nr:NAD(P)H-dependent oxidoreductase [Lacinutrix neustonica]WAC02611.1 NAD(P)H-dependent oxidoreductase [Lacinutrix neustonica]